MCLNIFKVDKVIKKRDPRKSVFKQSREEELESELAGEAVKGYNFEHGLDFKKYLESLSSTGFQATNLGKAIKLARKMREEKCSIFLGITSNVVSSGLRETVAYLVKNKFVHFIVTTTGAVEEDVIKCHKPFFIGRFDADGAKLRKKGINRTGNLFVPNERYVWFEKFMNPLLKKMLERQKQTGKIINSVEFVREIGLEMEETKLLENSEDKNKEHSFTYWAYKNAIPVFCPALCDGSLGDMVYFFKKDHPEFKIDLSDEIVQMNDAALTAKKTGAIIVGGSVPKHHIMNANMLREGADYVIYINTAIEEDGSDSGARPEEAKSWGKATATANNVKVWGEATLVLPLLIAGAFVD